jgi:hypothetical protein
MSFQVISRLPVREFSASVHHLSASVTNLLESINIMPTPSLLGLSCCCFGKSRREQEIVISEVVNNIRPDEEIDEEELEAKFAELVVSCLISAQTEPQ